MARVAKIKGDETAPRLVVLAGTAEYAFTQTENGDTRVTPVVFGKIQNSQAFEIPKAVLAHLTAQ